MRGSPLEWPLDSKIWRLKPRDCIIKINMYVYIKGGNIKVAQHFKIKYKTSEKLHACLGSRLWGGAGKCPQAPLSLGTWGWKDS